MAGQRPMMASPLSSVGGVCATTAGLRISRPTFHGLDDNAAQAGDVQRLEEVVVGALLHRLDGGVGGRGPGDENDGDAAVDLADLLVSLQPRQVGEVDVEQDDVGRVGPDLANPLLGRLSDVGLHALRPEGMGHLLQDHHRIVINQQQSSHLHHSWGRKSLMGGR
jgi:hypothetical protein